MLYLSRNQLKLVAMITMIIDHLGAIFFPYQILFRIIGRISFPIFAYLIADGMSKTHHQYRFLGRLMVFAVISQIPYMLAFNMSITTIWQWNIFVTLGLGALLCVLYQRRKVYVIAGLFGLWFLNFIGLKSDYGLYGILMVFYCFVVKDILIFHEPIKQTPFIEKDLLLLGFLLLSLWYCIQTLEFVQMFCIFSALLLPRREKKEPRWGLMGYFIYPIHLLVFGFIAIFL